MAEIEDDVTADVLDVIPEEEIRVCLFGMGEDLYAIPVELLTEIIISQKIFPIPATPSHVLGVINLRGNIVSIVDIRPALSMPSQSLPNQIAVVNVGGVTLGIVVDNVYEVIGVPVSTVLAIPADAGSRESKNRSLFLKGIIQRQKGVVALLDLERIVDEISLE